MREWVRLASETTPNVGAMDIALVDCEQQRSNDIPHLDDDVLGIYNRELDKDGTPVEDSDGETVKATSFCRKTLQTSKY